MILALIAQAAAIPPGCEIGEGTVSPDGKYAVIYPVFDGRHGDYPPNLLVQLDPYVVLAKLADPGLPTNVTTDLLAEWNGNSMVAIWEFRKWGIVSLRVFEVEGDRVVRVHDVWEAVRTEMRRDFRERLLAKFPNQPETIIFVSSEGEENPEPEFEFRGRHLRIDTRADNSPNLAPGPYWSARVRAVWDLDRGRLEKVRLTPGPVGVRSVE